MLVSLQWKAMRILLIANLMKKAGAGFLSVINSVGEAVTLVAAFFTLVSGLFRKESAGMEQD